MAIEDLGSDATALMFDARDTFDGLQKPRAGLPEIYTPKWQRFLPRLLCGVCTLAPLRRANMYDPPEMETKR